MPERTPPFSANLFGVLIVGGLLLTVLIVAIAGSVYARHQLDSAAHQQATITVAQERLDDLLRAQIGEEDSLREELATRGAEPIESADDPFGPLLVELAGDVDTVGLGRALPLIANLRATHETWIAGVVGPLRAGASGARADTLESYGKVLVDRLQSEVLTIRGLLHERMGEVQAELSDRIDQTVGFSIGFVVIFAVSAVLLTIRTSVTRARLARQHTIVERFEDALRVGWDPLPQTHVGTAYLSATAEAYVGGDFIDAWRDGSRGYFLIADVSGKGIDAAVNTAFVKYAIRTLASTSVDPGEILARFNELHLRTISDPSVFVVVFLGALDPDGKLRYASAGHELAFLRKADGVVDLLPVTGPVIGVFEGQQFSTRVLDFESPEMLLLATDGFTEARDTQGELLGVELASQIVASGPEAPQELCDYIIATVSARNGGTIIDDLALLSIAPVRAQASIEIG